MFETLERLWHGGSAFRRPTQIPSAPDLASHSDAWRRGQPWTRIIGDGVLTTLPPAISSGPDPRHGGEAQMKPLFVWTISVGVLAAAAGLKWAATAQQQQGPIF